MKNILLAVIVTLLFSSTEAAGLTSVGVEVNSNLKISGANNGLSFPDGTRMTTTPISPMVVDSNGQTIGALVQVDVSIAVLYVFLKELGKIAAIKKDTGQVIQTYGAVYYTTVDCTLQPYIDSNDSLNIVPAGSSTFFIATGTTTVSDTFRSYKTDLGDCNPSSVTTSRLLATDVSLPLTLPLVPPLGLQ